MISLLGKKCIVLSSIAQYGPPQAHTFHADGAARVSNFEVILQQNEEAMNGVRLRRFAEMRDMCGARHQPLDARATRRLPGTTSPVGIPPTIQIWQSQSV